MPEKSYVLSEVERIHETANNADNAISAAYMNFDRLKYQIEEVHPEMKEEVALILARLQVAAAGVENAAIALANLQIRLYEKETG